MLAREYWAFFHALHEKHFLLIGGIIEQVIEILLYLLCVAGLAVGFIFGAQV